MAFTLKIENLCIHKAGLLSWRLSNFQGFLLQARDRKGIGRRENRCLLGSCRSRVRNAATFKCGPRPLMVHTWKVSPGLLAMVSLYSCSLQGGNILQTPCKHSLWSFGTFCQTVTVKGWTQSEKIRQGWLLWARTESQRCWGGRWHYEDFIRHTASFSLQKLSITSCSADSLKLCTSCFL